MDRTRLTSPTQPGATQPGATQPGAIQPGATHPVAAPAPDPYATYPSAQDPPAPSPPALDPREASGPAVLDPQAVFDSQVHTYLRLGVPALHGLTQTEFEERVAPLRAALSRMLRTARPPADPMSTAARAGLLPLILVVPGVAAEQLMPLTVQGTHHGYVDMHPVDSAVFQPVAGTGITGDPYLILGMDTGRETLGLSPNDAGRWIADRGRLPLTIDEGIAGLLVNPGLLRAANCYQLLASRDTSKRIPSLWVTARGAPRLGWCYDRVPHSWLGSASCAERLAP